MEPPAAKVTATVEVNRLAFGVCHRKRGVLQVVPLPALDRITESPVPHGSTNVQLMSEAVLAGSSAISVAAAKTIEGRLCCAGWFQKWLRELGNEFPAYPHDVRVELNLLTNRLRRSDIVSGDAASCAS